MMMMPLSALSVTGCLTMAEIGEPTKTAWRCTSRSNCSHYPYFHYKNFNRMHSSIHFSPIQTHYMSCLKCDMKFESRSGNKARLREVLAKHMADAHDVSATCPTCYQVFNSSNNKKANQKIRRTILKRGNNDNDAQTLEYFLYLGKNCYICLFM